MTLLHPGDDRDWIFASLFPSVPVQSFPFFPVPIPKFKSYSHSHGIPTGTFPSPVSKHAQQNCNVQMQTVDRQTTERNSSTENYLLALLPFPVPNCCIIPISMHGIPAGFPFPWEMGHSHSRLRSFPLLHPIPKLDSYSHSHGILMGFPFWYFHSNWESLSRGHLYFTLTSGSNVGNHCTVVQKKEGNWPAGGWVT